MGCSPTKPNLDQLPGKHADLALGSSGLTEQDVKTIKRSWAKVNNNMPNIGAKVFLNIFKIHPEIKTIFPFRDVTGDVLLRDLHFKGHASRFMQAVGAAVDNIDSLEAAMVPLLFGLGQEHIHYVGFRPEYFDIFVVSILQVMGQEFGSSFTQTVSNSWRALFEFMVAKLKEGYYEAKKNTTTKITERPL